MKKTSKIPTFLNSGTVDLTPSIVKQIAALADAPFGVSCRFMFVTGIGHVMVVTAMTAEAYAYMEAKTVDGKTYKAKTFSVRGWEYEARD